jgi:hypothetical protein
MRRTETLLIWLLLFAACASAQSQPASRHFRFTYSFKVQNVPAGEKLRVWIPLAHTDEFQTVRVVSSTGDLKTKETREGRFGNRMLYAETPHASKPEYAFEVVYDVVRRQRSEAQVALTSAAMKDWLKPDQLVPVTGLPAQLAAQQVAGHDGTMDRARAIYDYVFTTMRYDKTGEGWGRGDVLYACDAKKGNCTDFHSLFIAMARSQGIASRFEIGFPLPPDKHAVEIAGYHCWADFYNGAAWVPIDISEAWKHPENRDYFFGHHDVNRVQFTIGRDLQLSPAQDGAPLNYFIYPYAEVAGKAYSNVNDRFSFEDVAATLAAK